MLKDTRRDKVIPLVIHGDAAMAGQGIVAEAFNYSQIPGYDTGGTIHLVINNQIGFTTGSSAARSSTYCSDVALSVQAPVFHVNGDDPEACIRATQIAADYRQRFHKDVVIDLICYRKNGHNEGDDPSYTQPLMYRKIKAQKPVAAIYAERLEHEGLVTSGRSGGLARRPEEAPLRNLRRSAEEQGRARSAGGIHARRARAGGAAGHGHRSRRDRSRGRRHDHVPRRFSSASEAGRA